VITFVDRAPVWVTVAVILIGLPAATVALQALIRRRFPMLQRAKHNDVAGFLVAVIGVIYAVTVGFIIASQWENYTTARARTYEEAFTLAGVAEASVVLGPDTQTEITRQVIAYNDAVARPGERGGQGEAGRPHRPRLIRASLQDLPHSAARKGTSLQESP
jgi:hypothetical protein